MSRAFSNISSSRRWGRAFLVFMMLFSVSWAAFAGPRIVIGGDLTDSGKLIIGGDLEVGITGGAPMTEYGVMLVDEADEKVAVLRPLLTDAWGLAAPQTVWERTGVVGCDPGVVTDPDEYLFEKIPQAEDILNGREFELQLYKVNAGPMPVAEREIGMVVHHDPIEIFPCDGAGCLRTGLDWGESLYIAIKHQDLSDKGMLVYVVQAQDVWNPGDPVMDVRPGGPTAVLVPPGGSPHVELLWAVPAVGRFQIVVRHTGGTQDPYDPLTDILTWSINKPWDSYRECMVCPPDA